jgi:subtilase-type serine protease
VGWPHALESFKPTQSLAFQGAAQNFLVLGVPLERDAVSVRAGFDLAVASGILLSISCDGSFAGRTQNNALRGGVALRF